MSTLVLAILSVLALIIASTVVLVLSMCKIAARADRLTADSYTTAEQLFPALHKAWEEEADRLAALPQGIPTDAMLNDMAIDDEVLSDAYNDIAIAMEEHSLRYCNACAYIDVCKQRELDTICPHTLNVPIANAPAPCDHCPYGPLESAQCMEHECCPDIMMYHNQEQ